MGRKRDGRLGGAPQDAVNATQEMYEITAAMAVFEEALVAFAERYGF